MKFSDRDKTMFQTVFSPSADEARTLLDFMRYLWDEHVGDRISGHPLYSPSALWKQWAGQTFTGFSLEKILLQGGHAFPSSVEVGGGQRGGRGSRLRRCLGALFGGREADRIRQGRDPALLQQRFSAVLSAGRRLSRSMNGGMRCIPIHIFAVWRPMRCEKQNRFRKACWKSAQGPA